MNGGCDMHADFLNDYHADMVAQTADGITDMNQVPVGEIFGLDLCQCSHPTSGRYCPPVPSGCLP